MKKLFLILLILTMSLIPNAYAIGEYITGTALDDFSTAAPKKYFTVKLDCDYTIEPDFTLKEGTILHGNVVEVSDGKIGKRQGYFVFKPSHYAFGEELNEQEYNLKIKVSFYKPFDKEQAAKKLASSGLTTVASKLFGVPLLSQGISFAKGVANSNGDSPIAKGLEQVYEYSPLSYTKKGQSLIIKQGQEVKLTIKEDK